MERYRMSREFLEKTLKEEMVDDAERMAIRQDVLSTYGISLNDWYLRRIADNLERIADGLENMRGDY